MKKKFKKNCPKCKIEMYFSSNGFLQRSLLENVICTRCRDVKNKCPQCGKLRGGRINTLCKKCKPAGFTGHKHSPETKRKLAEHSRKHKTFLGHKHSTESKQKISISVSGNKNGMFGKSVFELWCDKYGSEEAYKKLASTKKKISEKTRGSNNPMYGKPAPLGSGNGWSGWYKGWFFRSLLELSYMINVIERFGLKWEPAESIHYRASYWFNEVQRNYYPDFVIHNKYLVEIKPKWLWTSNVVELKTKAGMKRAAQLGMIYKLRDCPKLSFQEISKLVEKKDLVWTKRYSIKYEKLSKLIG